MDQREPITAKRLTSLNNVKPGAGYLHLICPLSAFALASASIKQGFLSREIDGGENGTNDFGLKDQAEK
jgi:hypothetical protein